MAWFRSRLVTTDLADDLVQPETNGITTTATYPILVFDNAIVRAAIGDINFEGGQIGRVEVASGTAFVANDIEQGYACQLAHDGLGGFDVRIATVSNDVQVSATAFSGTINGDLVFQFQNLATVDLACQIDGLQGSGSVAPAVPVVAGSMGNIAFFAHRGSAKVRWIEVIENTCPR